jgi:hypothetical protein
VTHRTKLAATALAVASLGIASVPAGADEASVAAKSGTRVSIQKEQAGFSGFVRSSRDSCESGRKVTLYRKSGNSTKRAGSDTAQPNQDAAQWSISVRKNGKYYAAVKATKQCKAARSRTLSIRL